MIIVIGVDNYDLAVEKYSPRWQTGVNWRQVGGVWHPIDRGTSTGKVSSTITVSGTVATVNAFRDAILANASAGGNFTLTAQAYEPVFGVGITYGIAHTCILGGKEPQITTNLGKNGIMGVWTFEAVKTSLNGVISAPGGWTYNSVPHMIQSITRTREAAWSVTDLEVGAFPQGYRHEAPRCEVVYQVKRDDVLFPALFAARTTALSVTHVLPERTWFFDPGATAESFYVQDVAYDEALDLGANWHTFTATFVKA